MCYLISTMRVLKYVHLICNQWMNLFLYKYGVKGVKRHRMNYIKFFFNIFGAWSFLKIE